MLQSTDKDSIISTLLSFDLEKLSKAKPGAVLYAFVQDKDDFEESPSVKDIKEQYPYYAEEFDYILELLKDKSSAINKAIADYKALCEKYEKLPVIFKEAFTSKELFDAIQSHDDIYDDFNPKDDRYWDKFDNFFYNSDWNYLPRKFGFDGPDDQTILSCYKEFDGTNLYLKGKSRFCIYDGTKENFKNLIKELEGFESDGLSISKVEQSEDTFGISFNAIQNTDQTRWITFSYSIKQLL